jgi:hypothetical protein
VLLIQKFQRMSAARTRDEFVAAVGTSEAARTMGRNVWNARRALDIDDARYTYERGGEAVDSADGTTSALATVSWRGGSSMVRFRLQPRAGGFDVVSASNADDDRLPVWLAGRVTTSRFGGVTVISVDAGPRDVNVSELARTATAEVDRLVPDATGDLTVVAPRNELTAAAVLGRQVAQVEQVAAVSAPLAGAAEEPAIIVNPALFADMDARARQVVMTHEATHVLTGIVGREVELWVAEGFADYVALHDDRAPLSVSAGQVLRRVKADGPPKKLPSEDDFDESAHGLSATYESAWMAFRMLGQRYGDAAVGGFYADVVGGSDVDAAARRAFGLSVADITADWRVYLTKSASTVS